MQDTPGDFYIYTVKVYVVAPTSELRNVYCVYNVSRL